VKVLHLLDSLNRGGAEMLELDVCRNAKSHGFDLTFAATGGGRLEEEFEQAAPHFVRLKRRLPVDPRVIWQLRRVIKRREIQIVHAHQAVEGLHAYFAALGTNAKLVLSYHGFVADAKNRRTLQFLLPRTAKNVFVSEALRRYYAEEVGLNVEQNYTVLHNGVDARRLKPSGKDLRKELEIPADAVLFGMIGNFYVAPRKDQITLVKALPKVFAAVPNTYCIFVGSIEDGAETKFAECVKFARQNGIFDRVRFLGVRSDVPDILNSLDVFVLSTLHEGLPIAVLEAMLAGVSCVLSDIEPNLEVSVNGEFTEIFPTQNSEILAEKLLHLAVNKPERFNLAAKAKQFAQNNYSIAAHLRKLKELYQNLI
jgi:glycosyltransferase involved in cell wall biosynthesis